MTPHYNLKQQEKQQFGGWAGGVTNIFVIYLGGGVEYVFPTGLGGSSKFLPATRKCNRPPPHLVINDSSLNLGK